MDQVKVILATAMYTTSGGNAMISMWAIAIVVNNVLYQLSCIFEHGIVINIVGLYYFILVLLTSA